MHNLTIGEKIRQFRQKAKVTQMDLELQIDASSGSISHIEKGDTNPSKETIMKIIKALDLPPRDAATLFNIEITDEFAKLIEFSKKFNTLDLNEVISNFVNDSVHELNLAYSVLIFIKDDNTLKSTPFTKNWYSDLILSILPVPYTSINISLIDVAFKGNLIRQAAIDKKIYKGERLSDFGIGMFEPKLLDRIQKIMGVKVVAAIPIISGTECLGVVATSWEDENAYQTNLPVFQAFINQISVTIGNIYKYEQLNNTNSSKNQYARDDSNV